VTAADKHNISEDGLIRALHTLVVYGALRRGNWTISRLRLIANFG
jgi:hypothetical protein